MSDNLCDTCLHKYCCMDSDAGIRGVNHSSCNGYAPIKNEEGGAKE